MSHWQTSPLLDGLTVLEQQVVDAARCGGWAGPDTVMPVEEVEASDDPGLRVRAELIRELLTGRRGEIDPRGLRIQGVQVVGQLDLNHVTAVSGLALVSCVLRDGMTCVRARLREVNLSGSHMSGLNAGELCTDGSMLLRNVTLRGTGVKGVRLLGAHIGGQLDLGGAAITNPTDSALVADNLRTDSDMFLEEASVIGMGDRGAMRLLGARIGGQLILNHAAISNETGPALHADGLRTDNNLSLRDSTLCGTGGLGAVRLLGAHIGGQLDLERVEITNSAGPALYADNVCIDSSMFMRDATLHGTGERGAGRLAGAHIGGQLDLDGIRVANESGPLVVLIQAEVTGVLSLSASVVCPHAGAEIGWTRCPGTQGQIAVRGLVFLELVQVSWRQWLHLLMHHTPAYRPQPYQQLAAVERALGHDNNARQILITQQEDLRRRAPESLGGWLARARHWLWGWLGRYGYRAHRLVAALAFVIALAAGLGYTAGQVSTRPGHHAAERVSPAPTSVTASGTPCSPVELIGLGIDRGLPLGATGLRTRCDLDTATGWGQAFTVATWILQALVWALATLAIAAYTGLVRKPT